MICAACKQEQANPEAVICEFCGEILGRKGAADPAPPPAAKEAAALSSMASAKGRREAWEQPPPAEAPPPEEPARERALPLAPTAEVKIGGSRVRIPDVCCCCLGYASERRRATAEKRGVVTKTFTTWEFPYCAACKKHADRWYLSWIAGAIAGFALFIGILSLIGRAPTTLEILGAVLAGTVLTVAVWVLLKGQKGPSCTAGGDAVTVTAAPFSDEEFTFHFSNEQYGGMFYSANA